MTADKMPDQALANEVTVDQVTVDEEATKPAASKPKRQLAIALPASVTLEYPYAYYAEDGRLIAWAPGTIVTDPADIADLIARKAPLKG